MNSCRGSDSPPTLSLLAFCHRLQRFITRFLMLMLSSLFLLLNLSLLSSLLLSKLFWPLAAYEVELLLSHVQPFPSHSGRGFYLCSFSSILSFLVLCFFCTVCWSFDSCVWAILSWSAVSSSLACCFAVPTLNGDQNWAICHETDPGLPNTWPECDLNATWHKHLEILV